MATVNVITLPSGWKRITGDRRFDVTRVGRPGRWTLQQNDDFSVLQMTVSYLRSDFETVSKLRFDEIFSFFLNTGAATGFLVDDLFDNTTSARDGSGVVVEINGVLRLAKSYGTYVHPITRPKSGVVLGGGAEGGTVGAGGIVTGASAGTWTGGYYWPMIFADNGIKYTRNASGTVESFDVGLEEVLEV